MANPIDIFITDKAQKQIDNLIISLTEADKKLLAISTNALSSSKVLGSIKTPTDFEKFTIDNSKLNKELEKQQKIILDLTKKYDDLKKSEENLNNVKKVTIQKTSEEIVNQRILTTNANRQATANSTLAGAYQKLSAQVAIASEKYQNIIARGRTAEQTQKQFNSEIKKAQNEFRTLQNRVLEADKAVDKWNRTGERSIGFAKNLISAFGIGLGVSAFATITTDVFNTAKELQSLDLGLKSVTGTTENFYKQQAFLTDISEKYGVEIKNLTKLYTSFYVSAKDKMAGSEIQEIFENIAKSGSALGLSNETLQRSFTALNQMLSKGTVASEELRGQLAESMPGAVQAMTKAVQILHPEIKNLTEKGLFQMIKDGKILANEVLPETARQLVILTGADKAQGIETLTKATNRFSNAWTEFVRTITEGDGVIMRFLSSTMSLFSASLKGLTMAIESKADSRNRILKEKEKEGYDYMTERKNSYDKEKLKSEIESNNRIIVSNGLRIKKMQEQDNLASKEQGAMRYKSTKQYIENQKNIENANNISAELRGRNLSMLEILNPTTSTKSNEKPKNDKQEHIKLNFDYIKSEGELAKAILERKRAEFGETANNESLMFETRIKARQEYSRLSIELIDTEYKTALALNNEKHKDDIEKNNKAKISQSERNQNLIDLNRDYIANLGKSEVDHSNKLHSLMNEDLAYFKSIEDKKKGFTEQSRTYILEAEKAKLKLVIDNEKLTTETRQEAFRQNLILLKKELDLKQIRELANSTSKEQTQSILDNYKNLNDQLDLMAEKESPLAKKTEQLKKQAEDFASSFSKSFLGNAGMGSLNIFTQLDIDGKTTFENLLTNAEGFRAKMAVVMGAVGDLAKDMYAFTRQSSQDNFDQEKAQLEEQYNISTAFAGDSAEAKKEIDKQYQAKQKEIKQREAKANKDMALFNIGINTAQGVISALASTPPNVPLSIMIGVIGLAQAAAVSSKEIPKYFKGGKHGGGLGMINDAGGSNYIETVKTPDGKISQYSGRNVVLDMPKGTEIFTPEQWHDYSMKQILQSNGIVMPKYENNNTNNNGFNDYQISRLIGAIENTPVADLQFDNGQFQKFVKNGHQTKISLNNRVNFKGQNV